MENNFNQLKTGIKDILKDRTINKRYSEIETELSFVKEYIMSIHDYLINEYGIVLNDYSFVLPYDLDNKTGITLSYFVNENRLCFISLIKKHQFIDVFNNFKSKLISNFKDTSYQNIVFDNINKYVLQHVSNILL